MIISKSKLRIYQIICLFLGTDMFFKQNLNNKFACILSLKKVLHKRAFKKGFTI